MVLNAAYIRYIITQNHLRLPDHHQIMQSTPQVSGNLSESTVLLQVLLYQTSRGTRTTSPYPPPIMPTRLKSPAIELVIDQFQPSDQATYTCIARNMYKDEVKTSTKIGTMLIQLPLSSFKSLAKPALFLLTFNASLNNHWKRTLFVIVTYM